MPVINQIAANPWSNLHLADGLVPVAMLQHGISEKVFKRLVISQTSSQHVLGDVSWEGTRPFNHKSAFV